MIPLIAALPIAQDVLSGVSGIASGMLSSFAPAEPVAPVPTTTTSFSTALSHASSAAQTPAYTNGAGMMRSEQWSQLSGTELQSWAQSLAGHHIDATDAAGHAITGVVSGVNLTGGVLSLNVGGHPVSLSNLKQISWSSATV